MKKLSNLLLGIILTITFSNLTHAQSGSSLSFDSATSDYASVAGDSTLDFTNGTIEYWVNPGSFSGNGCMVSMRDGSGTKFSLHLASDLQSIGMNNGSVYETKSVSLSQGTWYHFAWVFSSSGTEIYINGSSIGSLSAVQNSAVTGKDLVLGRSDVNTDQFSGEIDELRIWNDLRTASEISSSYQLQLSGVEENLVAYYNFDEGTGTTSSNLLKNSVSKLTLYNSTTWGANTTGLNTVHAKAISFDGTDDQFVIPYNSALDFTEGTIEFWVKPNYSSAGYSPTLFAMRDGTGTRLSVHMTGNRAKLSAWNGTNYAEFLNDYNFQQGTWYHLTFAIDASAINIYINGSLYGGFGFSFANNTGMNFDLGFNEQAGEYFNGEIDELRIWNIKLTDSQIKANYNSELEGQQDSLLAYYRFNEGSGTTARNWVQNSISEGNLLNGTAWSDHDWVVTIPGKPIGNGTENDPYLISNLDNLNWVSQTISSWGSFFQQTADIDASSTSTMNSGAGFSPIGNSIEGYFTGSYNGNYYTISGLTINAGTSSDLTNYSKGLFGNISEAEIKNLGLVDLDITGGYSAVGGLVGQTFGNQSTITNCYVKGNIRGANLQAGLLCGYNYSGTISNCYAEGTVQANDLAGVFVGFGNKNTSSISNCYARGDVLRYTGGGINLGVFAGKLMLFATINNCYAVGNVYDTDSSSAFSTSKGFLGTLYFSPASGNNFFDSEFSNQASDTIAAAKTTAEMKTASTFSDAGWDMTGNVWKIDNAGIYNDGYPFLAWENSGGIPLPVELSSFTAASTSSAAGETKVVLSWQTATEVDNYGFEIERSTVASNNSINSASVDEKSWETLGFVQGAGNSNSPKSYSYIDDDQVAELSRSYRLKQIDNDGQFKYSDIVEVEINSVPAKFNLVQNYPNPFNPSTVIRYSIPNENSLVTLKVYDILGNELTTLVNKKQSAGNYQVTFNASQFASGVYIYRLQTSSGFIATKKLMLLK